MDLEAFIRSYYETYNSEDAAALGRFYVEDFQMSSAGGVVDGRAALLAHYEAIIEDFSDVLTPESVTVEGDTVTVELLDEFTAKHDVADFLGQARQAGDTFELLLTATYEIEDGLIARAAIAARSAT